MVSPEFRLLMRALSTPTDVTSLDDEAGRRATIERDASYPGAVRARLDSGPNSEHAVEHWRLPPVTTRPSFFPEGVPFVAAALCSAQLSATHATVSWRSPNPPEVDEATALELKDSMPESLRSALERLKEDSAASGSGQREQSVESLARSLGDPAAREWAQRLTTPSEPAPYWVEAFQSLVAESLSSGWRHTETPPAAKAGTAQTVVLSREGRRRHLILVSTLGVDSLQMIDRPIDDRGLGDG